MSNDLAQAADVVDNEGAPIDRSYFWTEGCGMFALHLARQLHADGYGARIAVFADVDGTPWDDDYDFELTHVVVSVEGGYIAVNGFEADPHKIMERIGAATNFRIKDDWRVDEFEREFMGAGDKPLYGADAQITDRIARMIADDPAAFRAPAADRARSAGG